MLALNESSRGIPAETRRCVVPKTVAVGVAPTRPHAPHAR
jgi:hypothetical protein